MRFPIAAMFLVISMFALFLVYAVFSFMHEVIVDYFTPLADLLDATSKVYFLGELSNMQLAFGMVFVMLIMFTIVIFIVDSLRREPEDFIVR